MLTVIRRSIKEEALMCELTEIEDKSIEINRVRLG